MALQPKLQNASHFSSLQPLLSTNYNSRQVKSLLVLSLLFWQRPTFTDTQVGDSPLLFKEYIKPINEGLAPLVIECLKAGEARILIRDAFYRSPNDKIQDCKNLADVYQAWQTQGMPEAWVVPQEAPNRDRYIKMWNDDIPSRAVLSYDYLAVKRRFQENARQSIDRRLLREDVSRELFKELEAQLNASWFSHSGIFAAFKKSSLDKSPWAQRFGLLDEAAYSEIIEAGLAAINVPPQTAKPEHGQENEALAHINHVMANAFTKVDASDLSLLHLLTFKEIMEIRARGAFMLDVFRTLEAREELTDSDLVELSAALADYWRLICDEIARLHPSAAKGKTKLGLLVARQSIVPIEEAIDGLAVVLSGVAGFFTGGIANQKGAFRKAIELVSFRFLLQSERNELAKLRRVLSRNAVLRIGATSPRDETRKHEAVAPTISKKVGRTRRREGLGIISSSLAYQS